MNLIEQCIKQERWLHHHPKGTSLSIRCTNSNYVMQIAFRQLVKKAELLGHVSDTVMTTVGGRSKVTPSLTCDFVNYYIGQSQQL